MASFASDEIFTITKTKSWIWFVIYSILIVTVFGSDLLAYQLLVTITMLYQVQ